MIDHPNWDNEIAVQEAIDKAKKSWSLNGLITNKPMQIEEIALVENPPVGNTIEAMKTFVECRSCGKTAGYIISVGDPDYDFECMACYEDEDND